MTTAKLKASLALWRRREASRKRRHSYWQRKVNSGEGDRSKTIAARDKWSKLLREARDMVEHRERQLREAKAPRMVTSAQLGMTFQWVFGAKGSVARGAWHYTAGGRSKDRKALIAEMRADHRFHKSKGWGGLSYEVMIADDGTLGFGNPMSRKSAAVAGTNTGMVNICCPGTTGNDLTSAQERSVVWLKRNWHTRKVPRAYRLPKSASAFGWHGHREYAGQATACPGSMLSSYRKAWRR